MQRTHDGLDGARGAGCTSRARSVAVSHGTGRGSHGPTREMAHDRLMAAIHEGDRAAFEELWGCYGSSLRYGVRAFIRKVPRLVPYEDDIVGRAWVRLLERDRKLLRAYDPARGSFAAFMRLVGGNTAWRAAGQRKHPSQWDAEGDVEQLSATSSTEGLERVVDEHKLLSRLDEYVRHGLSERERAIFEEAIVHRRNAKDVASELGMSEQAVWAAVSRLRKKLNAVADELGMNRLAQRRSHGLRLVLSLLLALGGIAADDHLGERGTINEEGVS